MSVTTMKIRLAASGAELVGVNNGDTLTWNSATREWQSGPAAGATLIGDANGPLASNEVNSITPTVGGSNVALGDFTSDATDIRPVVRAPASGDVETVSLATLATALGITGAFDFVLESRGDLVDVVAPVGNVFTLPAGSYAIKTGFALNANESIAIAAGSPVLMMGMGKGKVLSGAPAAGSGALVVLASGAQAEFYSLNLQATDASVCLQNLGATLRTYGCLLQANAVGGVAVEQTSTDATWSDVGSRLESAADNFRMQGGFARCSQTFFLGGTGNCLDASGAVLLEGYFDQCEFDGGTAVAIVHQASAGDLFFNDCVARANNNGVDCISLNGCSSLNWKGGFILSTAGTPGDGIRFDGNTAGGVQIIGPQFDNLDDAVQRQAGTQRRVVIIGADSATNVGTGVDWQTANIPTNGLLITGCQFDTVLPFANFTETDARVNRKCNSLQSGLSGETPIVP